MRASPMGMRLFKRPAVVSSTWTPASLSGLEAWIEADPTKLYTDAGVTLVTADGDAVQQANDKTANARNYSQATLANRPLYRTGSGKPYLEFDGSNDFLKSGSYVIAGASGAHVIAVSCYFTNPGVAGDDFVWSATDNSTTDVSRLYAAFNSGSPGPLRGMAINGGTSTTDSSAGNLSAATPVVIMLVITATTIEVFIDNVSAASTSLAGTSSTVSAFGYIGNQNGAANHLNGRVYGLVHVKGTITTTEQANLQTYLAGLHP